MNVIRHCFYLVCVVVSLVSVSSTMAEDQPAKPGVDAAAEPKASTKRPDRAALEKEFSEKLTGAALVGLWSVSGQDNDKPGKPERYEIESVTKLRDDYWVFLARIKFGENDTKLPITLKVVWADDTPMISLTDLAIPGLGTFTSRVMFYGDRYAGTWQHGEVGGHLWGHIEKPEKSARADSK